MPINNYGNMGGQVFKGEIQILKDFLAKTQQSFTKMHLLNVLQCCEIIHGNAYLSKYSWENLCIWVYAIGLILL